MIDMVVVVWTDMKSKKLCVCLPSGSGIEKGDLAKITKVEKCTNAIEKISINKTTMRRINQVRREGESDNALIMRLILASKRKGCQIARGVPPAPREGAEG